MTLILDTKVNKYMINIIKEYLLPVIDKNDELIREIDVKTQLIMYYIDRNYCVDDKFRHYKSLINSKINKNEHNQWTIRYKN